LKGAGDGSRVDDLVPVVGVDPLGIEVNELPTPFHDLRQGIEHLSLYSHVTRGLVGLLHAGMSSRSDPRWGCTRHPFLVFDSHRQLEGPHDVLVDPLPFAIDAFDASY